MRKFIYYLHKYISHNCNETYKRMSFYCPIFKVILVNSFHYQKFCYSTFSKSIITHQYQVSVLEKEIVTTKRKPMKENIVRENILSTWFENLRSSLKSDPQIIINWNETNSNFILPVENKFKDKWPLIILSYLVASQERVPGLLDNVINLITYVKTLNIIKNQTILDILTIAILFNQGDDQDKVKAISLYESLKENITILDDTLGLVLIRTISNTEHWKDCLKYLQMVKISSTLNSNHITPLLISCTKHNDFENKDKLLNILNASLLIPNDEYFKFILRENCKTFFQEMQNFNWIVNENSSSVIKDSIKKHDDYEVDDASIKNGKCNICNTMLPNFEGINEKDFIELKKEFLAKVFCKKSNVFINSSPLEVEKFKKFSQENVDFDVVIDALNVRDRLSQKASKKEKDLNLFKVIEYFEKREKKILVLSRKHVQQMKTSSAIWFFTDNLSADDTFGLFVALNSKLAGAFYVSSDFLRDHSYLLGPRLAKIFKIWQQGHQVMFNGLNHKGYPIFRWPEKHDIRSHIYKDNIHIPYRSNALVIKFQTADKWLCIRRKLKNN